jgi:hypothetical protein
MLKCVIWLNYVKCSQFRPQSGRCRTQRHGRLF